MSRQHVLDEAVHLGIGERKPDGNPVRNHGRLQVTLDFAPIVIAHSHLDVGLGVEAGLVGDEVDRAAGGVLAVKRSLRPAQHFDALQIVELDAEQSEVPLVDLVDVARHGAGLIQAVVEHRHAAQAKTAANPRRRCRSLADWGSASRDPKASPSSAAPSCALVSAVTDTGTLCRVSERFSAVTTISWMPSASAGAVSARAAAAASRAMPAVGSIHRVIFAMRAFFLYKFTPYSRSIDAATRTAALFIA